MRWFRRREHRRPDRTTAGADERSGTGAGPSSTALVPLVSSESLERTERALKMLASQSAQLHGYIVQLEHRIDALSASLLDQLDVPSYQDVLDARMHSAKVAAELSRLEVNLAARLEAVHSQLRRLEGAQIAPLDLRDLSPTDTGWSLSGHPS